MVLQQDPMETYCGAWKILQSGYFSVRTSSAVLSSVYQTKPKTRSLELPDDSHPSSVDRERCWYDWLCAFF